MPHPMIDPGGALRDISVREAMTSELVTCTSDVPLAEVADLMVAHRIHSVVVLAPAPGDPLAEGGEWSVLSDLDLVAAAPWEAELAGAGSVAASPRVVVRADASLAAAALKMAEYATAHVLVVAEDGGAPVGILSALDVARTLAGAGGARKPVEPAAADALVRPGDRLIISAHQQGGRPRDAEVLEVRGANGGPPYLVRWQDTGSVSLHYPGSDASVEHLATPHG